MQQPSYLVCGDNRRIAYHLLAGKPPRVMFFTGFKSDMSGTKALALEACCRAEGREFLRFDYTGHGASSGRFEEGTIGAWRDDALAVFDHLPPAPTVLVGSSMGAWIALLLALARPERVCGFIGLASAPDFTERLVWGAFSDAQKQELMEKGSVALPNCYDAEPFIITQKLVEEGRKHLLLTSPWRGEVGASAPGGGKSAKGTPSLTLPPPGGGDIAVFCPVRLLHGTRDEDVPWQMSVELMERLASSDAALTLIKDGNHRLSEPAHLARLHDTLREVLRAAENHARDGAHHKEKA